MLVIIMLVLGSLSVFDFLRPYLFTDSLHGLDQPFQGPHRLGAHPGSSHQFPVWIVGMTGVAYLIFRRKDVLS